MKSINVNHLLNLLKLSFFLFVFGYCHNSFGQAIIADHSCTDITVITESAINEAKSKLHIGYGHTSHGSQITSGMSGLVAFANGGGLGLSFAKDIFKWNNGGTNGALDLEEGDGYGNGWLDHDGGYYPSWVNETREYLDDNSHSDVNVIMWSWCGQASGLSKQQMIDRYLAPMTQLEKDYPDVKFVYMTGHSDGSGDSGNLHLRNQQIRKYCIDNNKVLFDFYDIECYDPDGKYFGDKNVEDDCDYTGGNWAKEWQNSHVKDTDWYSCGSAHSQPLNANRKAYAIWWLWARLAGWTPTTGIDEIQPPSKNKLFQNYPNPFCNNTIIQFVLENNCSVVLDVFNLQGKLVKNIVNNKYSAGKYEVTFDKGELSPGIYYYCFRADEYIDTRKMILLK